MCAFCSTPSLHSTMTVMQVGWSSWPDTCPIPTKPISRSSCRTRVPLIHCFFHKNEGSQKVQDLGSRRQGWRFLQETKRQRALQPKSKSEKLPLKTPGGRKTRKFSKQQAQEAPAFLQWLLPDGPPDWYQGLSQDQEKIIAASAWLSFTGALALLLRVAVLNPTCVPSASMAPTLLPGDCVFVETPTYRFLRPPSRGEVVVFFPPALPFQEAQLQQQQESAVNGNVQAVQYVKRVVAVSGDTVEVKGGIVYVNGQPRQEEARKFHRRAPRTDPKGSEDSSMLLQAQYELPAVRVPSHNIFVLGDNRNKSVDSHVWGFLDVSRLVGRCWFRWSPLSRLGFI